MDDMRIRICDLFSRWLMSEQKFDYYWLEEKIDLIK